MVDVAPEGGQPGEIEVRPVGRPPAELDPKVVPKSRWELAQLLRELVFEPLKKRDFTQRHISLALGAGFSTAAVSRISSAKKLPTFAELNALLNLVEDPDQAGQALEPARRLELQLAHLRAVEAEDSTLYQLFMAESACQAFRAECERRWDAERSLKDELVRTHWVLHCSNQTTAAARARLARLERDRKRDAGRLAQMRRLLVETETELAVHKAALGEQALRLRARVATAEAARKDAENRAVNAQRKRAEVEQRLLEELADAEALAEELRIVRASRQEALRERDELRQELESLRSEDAVVSAARAAVRRAQNQLAEERLLVGAEKAGPAGAGSFSEQGDGRHQELLEKALLGAETAVADLVADLADADDSEAVAFVLAAAAGRAGEQVAALIQALGDAGYWPQRAELLRHAGQQPPTVVADLLQALERDDAITETGLLYEAAALADVPSLLNHLLQLDQQVQAVRLLDAAVRRRSLVDVAALLALLAESGRLQEAESLLRDAVTSRSPRDVLTLLRSFAALPDGTRFTALALDAAAERKPTAVVALCRALLLADDDAGAGAMAAELLARAALAPVTSVAETASLLVGDTAAGGSLPYFLSVFFEQRSEHAWQLITHVTVQYPDALGALLSATGASAPTGLLALLTVRADGWLPGTAEDGEGSAVTALLVSAGRRESEDVVALFRALGNTDGDLARELLGHTVRHSTGTATDVVATLLRAGYEQSTLLSYVSTGAPSLAAVVQVATALHERGHQRAASKLLHDAGSRARFAADEMTAVLHQRLPGWAAQCLLAGAATRSANLTAELAVELHQQGRSPFVQLMLVTVPAEPAKVVDLADHLWAGNLRHDAAWLLARLAGTASAGELGSALHLASPRAQDELITQIVQHTGADQYALLVADLCDRGQGHLSLTLVRAAGTDPAGSARACAGALAGHGLHHQAAWLLSQAEGGSDTAPWPPAEAPQELAQALTYYAATGSDTRANSILSSTVCNNPAMPWHKVLPQIPGAVLERTLLTVLEHLPRNLIAQARRPQVTAVLRLLTAAPSALRARLLQPPEDEHVAHLTNLLIARTDLPEGSHLAQEILSIAAAWPEQRDILVIAGQALGEGATAAASELIRTALCQRPLPELAPLIRFAVSHRLAGGRTEIGNLLKKVHPREHDAVEACLAEAFRPEFDPDIADAGQGVSGDWVVVSLPPLGENVTEGTVTLWLKGEGDHVEIDDPLLEVSTDKVDTEIPATATGIIRHITVAEDETVEIGATLCHIQPLTASAKSRDTVQKVDHDGSPRAGRRPGDDAAPSAREGEPPRERAAPTDDLVTVTLPALGESITEGTVTRWLKGEGDHVEIEDPLLEVSTDKVDTEITATVTGVLEQIIVAEDETADVGAALCYLRPRAEQGDGDRVPVTVLAPGTPAVTVGFGWHLNTVFFELDACAIAVDTHDRVYSSSHFVSGNRQTPGGTIVHAGGDRLRPHALDNQAVYLNLAALPRGVEKIVFPVYIYDGKNRGQHFGQLRTAYIRLIDQADGTEIVRYDLPEHVPADTALIFGELYRSGARWKFRADFRGDHAGMAGIAQHFGVDVLLSGHYVQPM